MVEVNDENDPFEEDIVFDQTGLLGSSHSYGRQQQGSGFLPTFMLFIRTVFLCVVFVSLGLCASISQGPIIHLEVAVGLPVTIAFHTFTAQSFGMLIGGLLGSKLFDIYNRQFLIFVSLMWMAVSIAILPFTIPASFWWTLSTLAAVGAGMSFIFTGSNVLCLDLWGKQGGASLQSLHFSFAVGALMAPIIVHPLLLGPYRPQVNEISVPVFNSTGDSTFSSSSSSDRVIRSVIYNESVVKNSSIVTFNENQLHLPLGVNLDSLTLPNNVQTFSDSSSKDSNLKDIAAIPSKESLSIGNKTSINNKISNVTSEGIPKPANPKPSFTNGNLLPDQTTRKKPSKKDRLIELYPKVANQSIPTVSTQVPLASHSTAGSHEVPLANQSTSTVSPKIPFDNQSALTTVPEVPLTNPSQSQVTYGILIANQSTSMPNDIILENRNISSEKKNISLSVEQYMSTVRNGDRMSEESEIDSATPSIKIPIPTRVDSLVASNITDIPLLSPDVKYVIDFSNNSESDNDQEIGDHDDMTYYMSNSKAYNDPQIMNLKEYSSQDVVNNETSVITVTASFSDNDGSTHHHIQAKPGTYSNISDSNLHPLLTIVNTFRNYGITSVHIIYLCTGTFILLIAFISICIMCHNPREPRSRQEEGILSNLHRVRIHIFICIFSIYMFTAEALQGAVHHLLASSQTENGMPVLSKSFGGQAVFWGLVCIMRFLCIIGSGCLKLKPGKILVMSTLFMVMGSIFLCIGTFDKQDFLWGGVVVVALGLAPVLPTCFLWMAEQMKVTHKMCALMIIVSSFGNTLTHTTLTHVSANSHLYSYVLIGISVCSLIFLTLSFCFLYKNQSAKDLAVPVGYHLANQEEDESMELTRPNAKNFDNINRRLSDMGEAGQALLID